MKNEKYDLKLETAILHACDQRNGLRSLHGVSPASLVFGYTPPQAGIPDEPHGGRPDEHPRKLEDAEINLPHGVAERSSGQVRPEKPTKEF